MVDAATIVEMFKAIRLEHPKFCAGMSENEIMCKARLWSNGLSRWTAEEAETATIDVLNTSRFEPKLADVVAKLEERDEAKQPTTNDLWNGFMAMICSERMYEAHRLFEDFRDNNYVWDGKIEKYRKITDGDVEKAVEAVFEDLPREVRRYLGDGWRLFEIYEMSGKDLDFEKARFMKAVDEIERNNKILREAREPLSAEFLKSIGVNASRERLGGKEPPKRLGDGDEE